MSGFVVVDVETRSCCDLRRVGAWRYAADPSTDVWCAGYAIDDQPVQIWKPGEPVPAPILKPAADPGYVFVAHNVGFERAILRHVLSRYGWPAIPVERWRCTMAAASAMALPHALDKVAKALGLPEQKANKAIVHQMAKPRLPRGNENPTGVYWFDDDEHREALGAYCRQDVETERALYKWLPPLIPSEQELWCLDQRVNDAGFYCDGLLIDKAIAIAVAADRAVQDEIKQITGYAIQSTNQVEKLLAWLAAHGCEVKDLQKATLSAALRRKELTPEVRPLSNCDGKRRTLRPRSLKHCELGGVSTAACAARSDFTLPQLGGGQVADRSHKTSARKPSTLPTSWPRSWRSIPTRRHRHDW
jgi:DNA polymerase